MPGSHNKEGSDIDTLTCDVKGADRYRVMPRSATHSARYPAAADDMGFSLYVNRGKAFPPVQLWYNSHWEANYLIAGVIRVTDMTRGPHALSILNTTDTLQPVAALTSAARYRATT